VRRDIVDLQTIAVLPLRRPEEALQCRVYPALPVKTKRAGPDCSRQVGERPSRGVDLLFELVNIAVVGDLRPPAPGRVAYKTHWLREKRTLLHKDDPAADRRITILMLVHLFALAGP
jgi:hypothetical protein